ncbi:hypothetical protein AX769_04435 [Frondihabitans sp. PAMC 28766]|nr:hypothetical protein AX769_04435 [Frondihabitans sp. PAMC 28766]
MREAVDAAVGGHASSHNAAGKGDAGNAFADGHDQASRSLLTGAAKLATALDDVADRMALSAYTHAAAEWASSGLAGDPPGYPVPTGSQSTTFGSIPAMHGGTGHLPPGWDLIQMVMSFVEYPDADTDEVRRTSTVWTTLGEDLARIQASIVDDILEPLSSVTAPDIAVIYAAVQPVIAYGRRLSKLPVEIAQFCQKFADLAEEVSQFIVTVLEQLLVAVVAEEAAGVLLTICSLGASDFLANAAAVAEALGAGKRIVTFIATFYDRVVAAVNLCTGSVRGLLDIAPDLEGGGALSKAAFVTVKATVGVSKAQSSEAARTWSSTVATWTWVSWLT